ncbi:MULTISPECIES: S9 family peptidase [Butyricimonas]|uniref:S9 family peptidase n=1 Tax=Butyricimonas TaxID=574697 RepID=UPI001D06AF15|nr:MULTISPECIES: DPP IV N-terminal domain-containing protein [Butyricimonas]MCB6974573.1 DPP IV N-terminal domain-containing protein [Butyricimonas synergistica]MCG4518305.1 DPP IV N-terminal domain-containing protein [Butyricimonas sp. DFI.6.44]
MVRYFLWILLCLFSLSGVGQKANYKQAERFLNLESLVGSTSVLPNVLKGTDKFWYKYETKDGIHYYFVDPKAGLNRELFNRKELAGEISRVTHKPVNYKDIKLSGFSLEEKGKVLQFTSEGVRFKYDLRTNALERVIPDTTKKNPKTPVKPAKTIKYDGKLSPDSNYTVYAKNHNLYLFSLKDSVETQLTTDGRTGYSYAPKTADSTKKVIPDITWFGDSRFFYAEREDKRKMEELYLVNTLGTGRPTLQKYKFAMPGDEHVQQDELHLFDISAKKEVKLDVEKWKDQKLFVYSVGRPAKRLYFTRKKRTCDEMELCRVIPETGEVKVLINEVCEPYFNDQLFKFHVLKDGEEILWWSERTGHGHWYRYDGEGNLKNAVTSGGWTSGKIVRIDTTGQTIYFEAYGQDKEGESPYYARLNKVRFDGKGGVKILTPEQATHKTNFLFGGKYFVDNYSRADLEPRSVIRNTDGKVVVELASPDLSRLYETGWRMPEPFSVKAADGSTDLFGYMWKPADFDSTKTYPIISYVYPGPQTEGVPLEFSVSTGFNNAALAQVGFIVVTFGHRGGSPLRDRWYHTYGYGNLRDYPLADDKYGIEQLADRYPFIDKSRVGIFGHSGGGFMSTAAICTYPDFYTAAVSSAGNHDNNIYNIWWGETHHGIKEARATKPVTKKKAKAPEDVKDSTKSTIENVKFEKPNIPTNIELAKNLKGHLLLVAGDADNNVHPANTFRMADALIKAGKNFDMLILPGQNHGYRGVSLDFFKRKIWFHFAKHLLGDYSTDQFTEIDEYMRLGSN